MTDSDPEGPAQSPGPESSSEPKGSAATAKGDGSPATAKGQNGDHDGYGPVLRLLGRIAGIGWTVAFAIVLGALAGYWLDGQLGTRPWLTIVGIVVGAGTAFTVMIKLLRGLFRS